MSYSIRALVGGQSYALPDYQSLEPGFDYGEVGGFSIDYPDNGINADKLNVDTIVVVYDDGVELTNGRYHIQAGSGSRYDDVPTTKWVGKSALDAFRKVIVYPEAGNDKGTVRFKAATPGTILLTLLSRAQLRGALTSFSWDFTATVDSDGVPWTQQITIEYRVGTPYLDIIRNLIAQGIIEINLNAYELMVHEVDTMGEDHTLGANQIELIASRDYLEMPWRKTIEDRAKHALVVGDDARTVERTSDAQVGPFGREEISVSQGGVNDPGTLNLVGDSALEIVEVPREEFTREVTIRRDGPRPCTDYIVGDYLWDRTQTKAERYRVRAVVLKIGSDNSERASVVLNDKLLERDITNSRRVNGILGGSTVSGGGNGVPIPPPEVDLTIPKPPEGVATTSQAYADVNGRTRAAATSSWLPPTENTDDSTLTDLAGFDVQHSITTDVTYDPATSWYPARADASLQQRWDRRGKDTENNWFGADGGSSVRAPNGEDWFFWSDTMWGILHNDGTSIWNSMPRSSITKSDPSTANDLRGFIGRKNMLSAAGAEGSGGYSASSGTLTYRKGGWGAAGRAAHLVITGGSSPYLLSELVTILPGKTYLLHGQIDPASTAPSTVVRYSIGGSSYVDVPASGLVTAGAGQTTLRLMAASVGPTSGDTGKWLAFSYAGIYETEHSLQTWASPAENETVVNEVLNPDGKGVISVGADSLLYTNYSSNPSGETGTNAWALYNSTTSARVTDSTSWSGSSFMRFTCTAGTGNKMMHYRIPTGTSTEVSAKFRIRASAAIRVNAALYQYTAAGAHIGGGDTNALMDITTQWQEVVVPARTMSGADSIGMMFTTSGAAWPAGVTIDIDGIEIGSLPFYFDGSTPTGTPVAPGWTSAKVDSSGTITATAGSSGFYVATGGTTRGVSLIFTNPTASTLTAKLQVRGTDGSGAFGAHTGGVIVSQPVAPGQSVRVYAHHTLGATAGGFRAFLENASVGLVLSDLRISDGPTALPPEYKAEWTGTAHASSSKISQIAEVRRNYATNPALYYDLTGWAGVNVTELVRDASSVPGEAKRPLLPEIVNPAGLSLWRTALTQAGVRSVGIAITGDSCTETTGSMNNSDLSDRYIERTQAALRREGAVPGVPTRPKGYYGSSTYIPVGYIHDGPIDWIFTSADPDSPQYQISPLQTGLGAGGRFRNVTPGVRAYFTARFDRVRLHLSQSGWGRMARILIDGEQVAFLNTYGPEKTTMAWLSPQLAAGEHTVVVEYVPTDGLGPGSVTVLGADIFEADYDKGVRIYDLSGSGKAAQDSASPGRTEIVDGFDRGRPIDLFVIKLGFNDYGRDAAWGGPRTAAQFKADVLTMISTARSTGFTGSTLLIGQWEAPQLTPGTPGETQANFRAKLREIALADPKVSFIDLSTVMPKTDYAPWGNGSLYEDGLHPSTEGQARVAEILSGVLSSTYTQARPAAARVTVTNASAQRGVSITPTPNAAWPVGSTYVCGVWVEAPLGAAMQLRWLPVGDGGGTINFVGTGAWQWVETAPLVTTSSATSGPYMIVRTKTAQNLTFRVSKALISRSSGPYFDGNSGAPAYLWSGTAGSSPSIMVRTSPIGWTSDPSSPSDVTFDPAKKMEGEGSVKAVAPAASTTGVSVTYGDLTVPANRKVTVIALVSSSFVRTGASIALLDAAGAQIGAAQVTPVVNADDEWTEARFFADVAVAPKRVRVTALGNAPAGSMIWVSELTVVADEAKAWHGSPFHGGQVGAGVVTSWAGSAHASKSTGVFRNSSSAPNFNQAGALFSPAAAGGGISEYVWVTGAAQNGNTAFVICNGMRDRALRQDGWNFQGNGWAYLAEYDLTAGKITRWQRWFHNPGTQWGEAMVTDATYLYVYGAKSLPGNRGSVRIMRVPLSNVAGGTREVWNGTAWVAHVPGSNSAASIATTQAGGGFTGVRQFEGKWIAVYSAGYMTKIEAWEAPAPQGSWTMVGSAYDFPTGPTYSLKYVPRFHPQLDSAELGIAIGFSEAGQNGNNHYGATFVRGPQGDAMPIFGGAEWGDQRAVDVSPDYYGGLLPGQAYGVRVRARDNNNNVSTWAYGTPIVLAGDNEAPPKPSTPRVSSFFRGIRIELDGLTENGNAQPTDFSRFTIHMALDEGFVPSDANLIDSLVTASGGVSVASDLTWGSTYYVKVVAWDTTGNASDPSDAASAGPERLSDADLPDKLIDGAKHIKDESLSVKNFTVGALDTSMVPNGGMEEVPAGPAGALRPLPTGWTGGWPHDLPPEVSWEDAARMSSDDVDPIAGSWSLRVDVPANYSRQVISRVFPLTPGDIYYVKVKLRTDRKLPSAAIQLNLLGGETEVDVNGFGVPTSANMSVGVSDGGQQVVTLEGQVEVPDYNADGTGHAMRLGAISLDPFHVGEAYTVWFDEVEVRRVVGEAAIANASINRAKIRYLAVDDARIASVAVGKLVAGELWADITVSARIMTAKTGQRVELNRDGMFGYNGTDLEPVTQVRADNGGLISRWLRTNSTGTRIEMGTYTMGETDPNKAALISFFPAMGTWQFPPAFGFGGESRRPQFPGDTAKVPGLAIHAGSQDATLYAKHGMNMFSVDQAGGIIGVTGNLLDTTEATDGAPIRFNAGGSKGYIELLSGGPGDWAQLILDPQPGESFLSLNQGDLRFGRSTSIDKYVMKFVSGETWLGINHILLDLGTAGAFRIQQGSNPNAFVFRAGNLIMGSGDIEANSYRGPGDSGARILTIEEPGDRINIRFDKRGNALRSAVGAEPAGAIWTGPDGLVWGEDFNAPKIRTRGFSSSSYISWNSSGDAFVDGNPVKTFVIPHPVEADKFLVHAAHEGDDMRVVYEGTSRVEGAKMVELPPYFTELTDPGTDVVFVQALLTNDRPLCSCDVRATRVKNGQFGVFVSLSSPGCTSHEVEFSWRVTAVRRGTAFEVEPLRDTVRVRGDGPYTYLERPATSRK